MTKDRTSEMILLREGSMVAEPHEPIPEETSESITSFLQQVECCRNEIQSIKEQIDVLKRYHRQVERSTNETTRKELDDRIEEKKTMITSSLIAIRNNVKSIQEIFTKQKISPALKRMKDVQINSLVRTLNEITDEYYTCLVDHSEKCKRLLYDMISISDENKAEFEELLEKGKLAFFTNNLLLNELEQKVNFCDVEDRHAEILKVERSITELRNLTQDLSLVVALQGEQLEHVEQYVEKTAIKVDSSAKAIKTAAKLKNKTRKRKLILSVVCTSVVIIIVTVIICV